MVYIFELYTKNSVAQGNTRPVQFGKTYKVHHLCSATLSP